MKTISITEFKKNFDHYADNLSKYNYLIVTKYGVPILKVQKLVVRRKEKGFCQKYPNIRVKGAESMSEALIRYRREER